MHRIVELSLKYRFLVIVFALLTTGVGIYDLRRLPIDAVPDITPNQVLILTRAPGLGPEEVERFITFPVETSMSGLPGITAIRSVSRFGLSVVYVFFEENMDIYFARRLVMERLPQAREMIPPGFGTPEMGPISTGLGEIYQFEVKGKGYSSMELRSILEWDIAPKLRSVPGVVEVNTYGGELKTYEVQLDANKLVSYNLSLQQVVEALERNNFSTGGAYIEHNREQQVIRGEGLVADLQDIENIVVAATQDGTPVYIRNIARVAFAPRVRQGAVTRDGRGEVVTGVVMMLIGANSRVVAQNVRQRLEEIKPSLPPGVEIDTYYDRTDLVRKTIRTVTKNLVEGGLLVIAVLLLLLGNVRGGLIVASAIPLSMLVAFTGMVHAKVSGNLMSLGAIDFGLIVDGSVVMIENIVRKLAEKKERNPGNPLAAVIEAGREVARPVFFAVGIIIIVYLPILSLQGVEGKMFRPMALTVIFALCASLLWSLTLMPVLASFLFRRGVKERETWILRQVKRVYLPLLSEAIAHPRTVVAIATVVFLTSVVAASTMGAEFIPRLDEGAIALQAWRLPSVGLSEAIANTTLIEKTLKQFPEIQTIVSRTGQAEIPTDPMGIEMSDIYLILKPHEEWITANTREGLITKINETLEKNVPGTVFSYSQPIELRMQELIAGVRSDISILLFGEDLNLLKQKAEEIVRVVSQVRGAADTKAEQTAGLPYLRIRIDRAAIARYGINAEQILNVVEAIGGKITGQVLEGQRRFFLQVRFREEDRQNIERIRDIKVADPQGRLIPLSQLAAVWVEQGPAQISRENLHRRIAVETNVRGRDVASFVAEAQRAIVQRVKLPPGYWIEWGGQFKNLQRASARLAIVVPLALFLIFVLLYTTFNSARFAALIFVNVPMAATGGIFALYLRGMPFSISAGVGFIALFGVAVLNGVVLVSYINQMRLEGARLTEAAYRAAEIRLRPVLMTALVASLGFVPMALSTSAGAEVQRPLATVVIGGLITSTLLTLLVLPAIYRWFEKERVEVTA
ncbi:MAG TPA: CusA/CzcA family heavy metal efflux RND transporter [Bryobacteraceae bacterium]|nr:CusA/CzcA family heavy metal efflux RND transporter [Bryobacteraceae bacterium]